MARPLAAVDDVLAEQLRHTGEGLLPDLLRHIRAGRGKYLRPALVFLAARTGTQPQRPSLVLFAAALELIHQATLIHDDIVDGSSMRRRLPSLPAEWGPAISVLAGDHLYSKAFRLLSALRSAHVTETIAVVTERLTRGELSEIEHRYDLQLDETTYFGIIEEKTAVLTSAACELGAFLAGAPKPVVSALAHYGLDLGMAFQIADDCLDLTGDAIALGKDVGADIARGCLSLPLIYLVGALEPQERAATFEPLFALGNTDVAIVSAIRRLASERGAVERAYRTAAVFAERAKRHVHTVGSTAVRSRLVAFADFVIERRG